jgi:hypothetical protein
MIWNVTVIPSLDRSQAALVIVGGVIAALQHLRCSH